MPSEKRKELTKQIIIRIKEVIQDMSDSEVLQKMAEAGEQTSIATVRRIRAAGSEDAGFNYNLTVKPFARVFLELSSKPIDVEALVTEEEKDRAALDNMIQIKNLQIDSLEAQVKSLETLLADTKAEAQRKIDHLREQLADQRQLLDDRKEFMQERRDFIWRLEAEKKSLRLTVTVLAVIVAVLSLLIFVALIIDRTNSGVGFFWLEETVGRLFDGAAGFVGNGGGFFFL